MSVFLNEESLEARLGHPAQSCALHSFIGHDSIDVSKQGKEEPCILMQYNVL